LDGKEKSSRYGVANPEEYSALPVNATKWSNWALSCRKMALLQEKSSLVVLDCPPMHPSALRQKERAPTN
jgi:hypothetical protein